MNDNSKEKNNPLTHKQQAELNYFTTGCQLFNIQSRYRNRYLGLLCFCGVTSTVFIVKIYILLFDIHKALTGAVG